MLACSGGVLMHCHIMLIVARIYGIVGNAGGR